MSDPKIDTHVALAIAEGVRATAVLHHEKKREQYAAHPHLLAGCPEVRGPFFCSATVKVTVRSVHEVDVVATILYPGNRKVILEGVGDFGLHLASDGTFHVAGVLGPDPDQMVGEVAFSIGGAATGIGPINFAMMKKGCFVGDMFGIAFIAGAFAIVGTGKARIG